MRLSPAPFSGRVIFDHIPKTAGQAVSNWLRDELGDGTVSPNLVKSHREILSRSIEYPILSGHVFFEEGEGLEPRFQYVTLLREPVDRTLSWLFFVTRNHKREDLPELYDECLAFLASDGEDLQPRLAEAIVNPMVAHYAQILGKKDLGKAELVDTAYRAVRSYDCVGTYERLPEFIDELARLLGIASPESLRSINVTRDRPKSDDITSKLRANILAITKLDRQLHSRVTELVGDRLQSRPPGPSINRWSRYEKPIPSARSAPSFAMVSVTPPGEMHAHVGGPLEFELEVEFGDPVSALLAGIQIRDDRKQCAFGVNNRLLGRSFTDLEPGRYRVVHSVTADLPAGNYSVGFSFADLKDGEEQEIYWEPGLVRLTVHRAAGRAGVGYAHCEAEVLVEALSNPSAVDALSSPRDTAHGQIAA